MCAVVEQPARKLIEKPVVVTEINVFVKSTAAVVLVGEKTTIGAVVYGLSKTTDTLPARSVGVKVIFPATSVALIKLWELVFKAPIPGEVVC